jgi:transcriptional regulator with XRE-family HTH domain
LGFGLRFQTSEENISGGKVILAHELRAKRAAAGIPGQVVCQLAGISSAKLSDIERGYLAATPKDLNRIGAAIEEILSTRRQLTKLAIEAGLSLTGVRL